MHFVCNFPEERNASFLRSLELLWDEPVKALTGHCLLMTERLYENGFFEDEHGYAIIQGFLRDERLMQDAEVAHHHQSFFDWLRLHPQADLPDWVHGAFSFVYVDIKGERAVLGTDWIGCYPVYYGLNDVGVVVSNSVLALKDTSFCQIDPIGVAQRLSSSGHYNYGRRTILQGVNRLLGGERVVLDLTSKTTKSFCQSGLFKIKDESKNDSVDRFWESIRKEYQLALINYPVVHIGQSGGLDSRLVLAAMPEGKKLVCHTHGEKEYYESIIAEKLARLKGARWNNYPIGDNFVMHRDKIDAFNGMTEALEHGQWISVMEQNKRVNEPFVLGDLCEAYTGRYIKHFRSRKDQVRSFLQVYLLGKPLAFVPASEYGFAEWSNHLREAVRKEQAAVDVSKFGLTQEGLYQETLRDLEVDFHFVKVQNIPFVELYDEFWGWHHSRAKQMLFANARFFAVSPTMSRHVLQAASEIKPEYRLNYQLAHRFFNRIPALKPLARIPTTQIPYIPFSAPNFIKLLWWGMRSYLDRLLMKRIMKRKNPTLRYRVVPGINLVQLFQFPQVHDRIMSWFPNDQLGLRDAVLTYFVRRQKLERRPMEPFDQITTAALESEIDYLFDGNKAFDNKLNI